MDEVAVRIGDTERWAVDARLQQAVGEGQLSLAEYEERAAEVWRARTRPELDLTTRDLPVPAPAPAVPVAPPGGRPRTRRVLAVMSGDELSGPVVPGQGLEAYAVMGGASIDLRRKDLPAEVHVRAVAVMGGIEILVPRGVSVHLSGLSVMGGREMKVDPPRPGAPVVHVESWALMGGVVVGHGKETDDDEAPAKVPAPRSAVHATSPVMHAVAERAKPHRRGRAGRFVTAGALVAALAGGAYVATQPDGAVVFGSSERRVDSGHVRVGALFGSITVVVPDEARVTVGGVMVFGSSESDVRTSTPQGPEIEVDAVGGFGSVEVVTQSQAADKAAEDDR